MEHLGIRVIWINDSSKLTIQRNQNTEIQLFILMNFLDIIFCAFPFNETVEYNLTISRHSIVIVNIVVDGYSCPLLGSAFCCCSLLWLRPVAVIGTACHSFPVPLWLLAS